MGKYSITEYSNFHTVNNQRIIKVYKAPTDKEHLYTSINLQALNYACNCLQSKAGIKLWLYIARNTQNYTFGLSRKDFMKFAGCAEEAYKSAVKELIDNGYLIHKQDNLYWFREEGKIEIFTDNSKPKEEEQEKQAGFVF